MALPLNRSRICAYECSPEPICARVVRRFVRDIAEVWGYGVRTSLLDDLVLVASELVTNAVRHAGYCTPLVRIELRESNPGLVRLTVSDGDTARPRIEDSSGLPTTGWGLTVVQEIAAQRCGAFGVTLRDDGKSVWVELPVPSGDMRQAHTMTGVPSSGHLLVHAPAA